MGKKQKNEPTNVTAETFKIHKNKSLSTNLNEYIRVLKTRHSELSTKQYLNHIHKFIYAFSKKKGSLPQALVVQTTSRIKICKKCDKWAMGTKKMVQCEVCEDYYHLECAHKYTGRKDWKCSSCSAIVKQETGDKKEQLLPCAKCGKNKNQVMVKCLKCLKLFHKICYAGQSVVCGTCNKQIETKIKKQKQLTLQQSFQRAQKQSSKKKARNDAKSLKPKLKYLETADDDQRAQQSKAEKYIDESTNASTMFSTARRFRAGYPEMTPEQIQKYKQNLLFAILSKNMQYTQQLQCHDCDLYESNEDSVDFAILHLSMSDLKMFKAYQKQPIGPFLIQYKEQCGYDVIADKDLPKGMIVCEYVGDVYTFRDALTLEANDSVMELKKGKNADESLLIVPRKFTNIARFINGINNKDPEKAKKQNVDTLRTLAHGRPVVILYTLKSVKKGQSLLYDYGAGIAKVSYDTSSYQ